MAEQYDLVRQLERRARGLEAELADKQERLRQLQNEIRTSQGAIDALNQVVAYERASRGETVDETAPRLVSLQARRVEPVTQTKLIADAAQKVLEAEGPLHYRELTDRLLAAGVVIGGNDPNAGVVGALVRDGRFYRPARGTYYLRKLADGPIKNVGQRHHRKGA